MVHTVNIETKTKKLPYPKSIAFIVTNEFCERFSYYGLRTILVLYLRNKLGFDENGSTVIYHVFTMCAYFFPVLGAMIADGWLGRFRTIMYLSIVYALGSVLISLTAIPLLKIPSLPFTIIALLLIAFGTGGIKPCVSAFGGDQFKLPEQERNLATFFSLFYFAINAGSTLSTFITPILRLDVQCFGDNDCYSLAFGVPAILMIVSIVVFFAGKRLYKIKNPTGSIIGEVGAIVGSGIMGSIKRKDKREHWLDHATDKHDPNLVEDVKSLMRVLLLFVPLPVFWALFDQQGSRWTFQADRMEQRIGSFTLKSDQMQVVNPLLILVFIPIFEVAIYPFMTWCKLISKPLHKMIWGGFLAATAFVISGIVELSLLPTYGIQPSTGLSQLRVYNGYPCNFSLNIGDDNITEIVPPLGVFEKLDIATQKYTDLPYRLQGEGIICQNVTYSGEFHLSEKKANSFFIRNNELYNFTDNNDKAIDGANIRVLVNTINNLTVKIINNRNNRTILELPSYLTEQNLIDRGTYKILLENSVVFENIDFEVGAVYTINIYANADGNFIGDYVIITPPNTLHILWLLPQYIIMTMGEVMFSVTGLEFSFTQAPASMKSVLQSMWLLTVAFGNLIVILVVQSKILDEQWQEFFMFAGLMIADMLIFMLLAFRYKYVEVKSSKEDLTEEIRLPEKSPTIKND